MDHQLRERNALTAIPMGRRRIRGELSRLRGFCVTGTLLFPRIRRKLACGRLAPMHNKRMNEDRPFIRFAGAAAAVILIACFLEPGWAQYPSSGGTQCPLGNAVYPSGQSLPLKLYCQQKGQCLEMTGPVGLIWPIVMVCNNGQWEPVYPKSVHPGANMQR